MKRINRMLCMLMILSVSVWSLMGCGSQGQQSGATLPESAAGTGRSDSLRIVTTSYPQYDFVRQILGNNPAGIEVTYLLGSGVDMHNFQPSAEDIISIRTSDLFLYIGGESDLWVETLIGQIREDAFRPVALADMVEMKAEKIVEGMQHEHEEDDDDHSHEEEDDHDHVQDGEVLPADDDSRSSEFDEHVWLSLKNAEAMVDAVCDEITALDPEHKAFYLENAAAYITQIRELDSRYAEMVQSAGRKTILVADRFPFRYLADDYGLTYYAAFPGCSAETEASFDTVVFLAEKVGELKLPAVFKIEGSNGKIAETVIANSTQPEAGILTLNSIQSVSNEDITAGVSYLGLMEENLNQLKEALN